MLEAKHVTAAAKPKGSYALPEHFDGTVNETVVYHVIRAHMNNQRHGTHKAKTRGEVSGGNQKPWRQKGTGRARQGSTRAPNWPGGGKVFGPLPRKYRTEMPKKVRQLARTSAFNARAHGCREAHRDRPARGESRPGAPPAVRPRRRARTDIGDRGGSQAAGKGPLCLRRNT